MKPFLTLAREHTEAGAHLSLHEHDGEHYLQFNGRTLMSTRATVSERKLADLACESLQHQRPPRILIGGLGFGFTLRRVLELAGPEATVEVVEIFGSIVRWNREFLRAVNGQLLDDARVTVFVEDVYDYLQGRNKDPYDAILLDVDNGPTAMVRPGNSRLYHRPGLLHLARALKPGGTAAFWSAAEERPFARRLAESGFQVRPVQVNANERGKGSCLVYVARHRDYSGGRGGSKRVP
ncbi:MAG TPA: hypothetical protein VGD78_11565 [Chthoniobacterales bacterium]